MLNKELHDKHMKNILKSIFAHEIGKFLAFKGGTLAYRVHNLDRFSTDIDLDILDLEQEKMIIQSMREILVKIGDIKNETLGKNLHRRIFRYDEKSMNIKIELNKRDCSYNTYEMKKIVGSKIPCMATDCIFSNKLIALSSRFANRDLYDTYFFFKNKFPLNEKIVSERTGLKIKDVCKQLIKELPKRFTENSILAGLGEVLTDKQKIRVKKYLMKEVIKYLKALAKK